MRVRGPILSLSLACGTALLFAAVFVIIVPSVVGAAGVVGTGASTSCTDAALDTALVDGGLVTFDCGGAATIDISTGTGTKMIDTDTTVDGGGRIIISGGNAVTVFSLNSGVTFTVKNLTITDGRVSGGNGGGMTNNGGSLSVTNCTMSGNSASEGVGGGIINFSGTLTVTNSTFTGNSADVGGGGIVNNGGSVTVANSTFSGNRAGAVGGGGSGGAIYNNSGSLTVSNSTFSGNSAVNGYGGGILNADGAGPLTITNSTFTDNSADDAGGGILNAGGALVRNTLLANSPSGRNCSGSITDGGHNLDDGTSCGFSAANGSLSGTDPQLDPAGLHNNGGPTQTVALCLAVGVPAGCTGTSAAIDAGDQDICAMAPVNDLDQRGIVRPGAGHTHCSVGAYEADAAPQECIGDCAGTQMVAVNDIITLVNIALGNAQPSACPHGIASGADVTVVVIIEAVNNALNGCGVG